MCIVSNLIPLLLLESHLNIGQITYFLQLTLLSITWPMLFQHIYLILFIQSQSFSWEVRCKAMVSPATSSISMQPRQASWGSQVPGSSMQKWLADFSRTNSQSMHRMMLMQNSCGKKFLQVMKWQMIDSCKRPCWFFAYPLQHEAARGVHSRTPFGSNKSKKLKAFERLQSCTIHLV